MHCMIEYCVFVVRFLSLSNPILDNPVPFSDSYDGLTLLLAMQIVRRTPLTENSFRCEGK